MDRSRKIRQTDMVTLQMNASSESADSEKCCCDVASAIVAHGPCRTVAVVMEFGPPDPCDLPSLASEVEVRASSVRALLRDNICNC